MNPLMIAQERYSTKKYDPNKSIPTEKIEELKKVLHLAPSSINIQPWKFTFVMDPKMKEKLANVSQHNTEKINQAPLLVVFSAVEDLEAFQPKVEAALPQFLVDWYNSGRKQMSEAEIKTWFAKQVYIALGQALTATAAMGLDSTPMEGIESDKYMEVLGMKDYRPLVALSVGYAAADDHNRLEVSPKSRRPFEDVIETI